MWREGSVQYGTCVYRTGDPREAVSVAPVKRPRSRRRAGLKVWLKREGEQTKLPRPVPFSRLGVVLFTMEGRREWSPVVVVEWSGDGTRAGERVHGLLERLITLELSGTRAIRFTGGPRTTTDRTKIDVIEIIIRIGYSTSHPCVIWNLTSGIWHQSPPLSSPSVNL